jgi:triosephosphate isomerase
MNLSIRETIDYAEKLKNFVDTNLEEWMNIDVYIIPDYLSFHGVSVVAKDSQLKISAQNCFYKDNGAFTGEVSPKVLKEYGCSYVMLGHPERIIYGKEDIEMINKKVKAVLKNRMAPVLFAIEREKKREMGRTVNSMLEDLIPYLEGVSAEDIKKIVFIYEPAWAIGTGKAAPVDHSYEVIKGLREAISGKYGNDIGEDVLFQYGGGVTLESAGEIMKLDNINGIGMGRAGLNIDFFTQAVKIAIELQRSQKIANL